MAEDSAVQIVRMANEFRSSNLHSLSESLFKMKLPAMCLVFLGATFFLLAGQAVGVENSSEVLVPRLSQPWAEAVQVVGGAGWCNDFCLIKDKLGKWHCFGIGGQDGSDATLFHAVGESLDKPFAFRGKIASGIEPKPYHMWAPFAVWKDDHTAYLYYAHIAGKVGEFRPNDKDGDLAGWCRQFGMRLLESTSPDLETWAPYKGSGLTSQNQVFQELAARDPCIFWDERLKSYLMYYAAMVPCGAGKGFLGKGVEGVIRVRTAPDLVHWSNPRTVIGTPPNYVHPESPFVLFRNGYYYLWVSGYDYSVMSLYISEDPFSFGDAEANRIAEQKGHAVEIVTADGVDYMASVQKSVRIQKIEWVPAGAGAISKITRKSKQP